MKAALGKFCWWRKFLVCALLASCLRPDYRCLAGVIYASDFSGLPDGPAHLPDWILDGGTYVISDGWLCVTSERSNPVATLPATCDADFTFRARVRNARGCHWSALLARGVYRLEVNNQFVRLGLYRLRDGRWDLVAQAPAYELFLHNTQEYELRLVGAGNRIFGFLDDKKLVEFTDPDPVPPGGSFALLSGWGTNLAWRDVRLEDQPDLREWPYETLPEPTGRQVVEVVRVRGVSQTYPFDNIYFDGQTAAFRLWLRPARDDVERALLRFRLINVRQEQVAEKTAEVRLAPDQETQVEISFAAPARGCFKVALDAGTAPENLGWVEDVGSFTVVSRELFDRPRLRTSYFGGHMDGINLAWHLAVGRKLGIQWARCHDMMQWTWWDRVQPNSRDEWVWYDDAQRIVDEAGMETSGEFLWVPPWAQKVGPDAPGDRRAYPPASLDDFSRYVYETVSHYQASIKHWEVWNEPHFHGFWAGTPEEYAELLKAAYRAAKQADPDCVVLGGGGVNPRAMAWIEQFFQAVGDDRCMDGFTYHYLEPDYGPHVMPRLKELLRRHGVTGPLWNSEENVPSTSFFDQCRATHAEPEARYHFRNACFELVRCYMENIAAGAERIFYYELADPWRFRQYDKPRVFAESPINGSMWDEGQMLKPLAAAHAALALAIDGREYRGRLSHGPLQVFLFEGTYPGAEFSAIAVQYAELPSFAEKRELRLSIPERASPADFTAMDFMGNEYHPPVDGRQILLQASREPVYLFCHRHDGAAVLSTMYAEAQLNPPAEQPQVDRKGSPRP
ncbi:MAG: hypothetical protein N2512_09185 [Armatimonadetes bacterium]|nr:hypothetical protein [Armatimonadota bacterium]